MLEFHGQPRDLCQVEGRAGGRSCAEDGTTEGSGWALLGDEEADRPALGLTSSTSRTLSSQRFLEDSTPCLPFHAHATQMQGRPVHFR